MGDAQPLVPIRDNSKGCSNVQTSTLNLPSPPTTMPSKPAAHKGAYIETDTGNKVARKSQLYGTQFIILGGRVTISPDVCIRGDLIRSAPSPPSKDPSNPTPSNPAPAYSTTITIGRYSYIGSSCILRPPYRLHRGLISYHPLKIGEHTYIGPGCVIEAASLGDHVHIGAGAVVGKMCIVKDGVKILPGSVLPMGMVVGSGSVVGGRPGRVVGEVGEGWGVGDGVEGGDLREVWRGVG